jgi:hypothetical protein
MKSRCSRPCSRAINADLGGPLAALAGEVECAATSLKAQAAQIGQCGFHESVFRQFGFLFIIILLQHTSQIRMRKISPEVILEKWFGPDFSLWDRLVTWRDSVRGMRRLSKQCSQAKITVVYTAFKFKELRHV